MWPPLSGGALVRPASTWWTTAAAVAALAACSPAAIAQDGFVPGRFAIDLEFTTGNALAPGGPVNSTGGGLAVRNVMRQPGPNNAIAKSSFSNQFASARTSGALIASDFGP
jgi:hypothetical protein